MKPIADALSELDASIATLIESALRQDTRSESSLNDIVTGNAYQSLRLRDTVRRGFRDPDMMLFAGMPISGRRFVDLGCNLGEKTRLAILAGAAYAEGIEYEEFFVRIGGLVSVYNRISGAVIRQGDITRPGCLLGKFDIGGCFSAFVYAERNLKEILERIEQLFMLETHALDGGWYGQYVGRIKPFMPFWMLHGFTDHGMGHGSSWRALMLFGRESAAIKQAANARSRALPLDHGDVRWMHLSQPSWHDRIWGKAEHALFYDLRSSFEHLTNRGRGAASRLLADTAASLQREGSANARWWGAYFTDAATYATDGKPKESRPTPGVDGTTGERDRSLDAFVSILTHQAPQTPLAIYNPIPLATIREQGIEIMTTTQEEFVIIDGMSDCVIQQLGDKTNLAALWLIGAQTCPVLPIWTNIFGLRDGDFPLLVNDPKNSISIDVLLGSAVLGAPRARQARS